MSEVPTASSLADRLLVKELPELIDDMKKDIGVFTKQYEVEHMAEFKTMDFEAFRLDWLVQWGPSLLKIRDLRYLKDHVLGLDARVKGFLRDIKDESIKPGSIKKGLSDAYFGACAEEGVKLQKPWMTPWVAKCNKLWPMVPVAAVESAGFHTHKWTPPAFQVPTVPGRNGEVKADITIENEVKPGSQTDSENDMFGYEELSATESDREEALAGESMNSGLSDSWIDVTVCSGKDP